MDNYQQNKQDSDAAAMQKRNLDKHIVRNKK
jgi:hypothetical protein